MNYKTIFFFLLLISISNQLIGQINFKMDGPLEGSLTYTMDKPGACSSVKMAGIIDKSRLEFKVTFGYKTQVQNLIVSRAMNFATEGQLFTIGDLIPRPFDVGGIAFKRRLGTPLNANDITTISDFVQDLIPTPQCDYHIIHSSGIVEAYVVNSVYDKELSKRISGGVDFSDKLEIISSNDDIIELPLEVSAALVAVQTFCNPEKSMAQANAELTATLGGNTASIKAELILKDGEFLKNEDFSQEKKVKIKINKGVNILDFKINGSISAKSIAQGLSKLNSIACGSNAAAIASHSLIVKGFTGENGGPLPQNILIRSLLTNTNYTETVNANNCPDFSDIKFETINPTCGEANGEAKIVLNNNNYSFEWSTGSTDENISGLKEGGYFLVAKNVNGCYKSFPFSLKDVSELPTINLPEELLLTLGDSVVINALNETDSNLKYEWSTGETTPSIVVVKPGEYSVLIKNSTECSVYKTVKVIEKIGYWISDGDKITDSGLFFDDGGRDKNYSPQQNSKSTICPKTKGKYITLDFQDIQINNCSNQDILALYEYEWVNLIILTFVL